MSTVTNPSMDTFLAGLVLSEDDREKIFDVHQASLTASAASADETREIAKTIASVIKPRKLDPFVGNINAEECLNFIESQSECFSALRLAQSDWVQFIALNLVDTAKSWWPFTAYFTPLESANLAHQRLHQLRQNKSSVAVYTKQFRRLLRLIPNMDNGTAL
ncbi:hypothetical protein BGX26_002411 [Mortierella sp. AD094]|nr:hypothetical protein BGX26_002411 [Mortierella sp. AD094]